MQVTLVSAAAVLILVLSIVVPAAYPTLLEEPASNILGMYLPEVHDSDMQ